MGSFDPKRVPVTDWVVVGAGVVALVASFLTWRSREIPSQNISDPLTGWESGFGGWFPVLLLVALAAFVVVRATGTEVGELPVRPAILVAGVAALAAVIILLRMLTYDDTGEGTVAEYGYGPGIWLALVAAVAAAAAAFVGDRRAPAPAGPFGNQSDVPPPPA